MKELETKLNAIRRLLSEHHLDALLLRRVSSFAWATCGAASYVNTASTEGAASLLITPDERYLITDNIEAPRLEHEEHLKEQGWEFRIHKWHENSIAIAQLTRGLRLGTDTAYPGAMDLSAEIARLRASLTPEEGVRFRKVGRLCAKAMKAAIREIRPGMSEYEIAGRLSAQAEQRGCQAIVNLIATDQRVFSYRHPLPTEKRLERYAMLVLCGRRWGLVANLTRLVHFGAMPDEIRGKAEAVARVDATFIAATRPGKTIGQVLEAGIAAYREAGYPEEWKLHHQGGAGGYDGREYIAVPGMTDPIRVGQVYAWNPSITGVKSEDTFLVGEEENEILTAIEDWPTLEIEIAGKVYRRPKILEID
jgi:antitoxin VapB